MIIRAATLSDIDAISTLLQQLTREHIAPTCSAAGGELLIAAMSATAIKGYFDHGYRYFVGECDGVIIGVVAMKERAHLYHLFVADAHQGKGYASQLWRVAQADSIAAGYQGPFTVNSALSAEALYFKLGFRRVSGIRERSGIKDIPMQLTSEVAVASPADTVEL